MYINLVHVHDEGQPEFDHDILEKLSEPFDMTIVSIQLDISIWY
jgi:hypothetical protein